MELPAAVAHYPLSGGLQETVGDHDATAVGTVSYDDGLTLPGNVNSSTNYVRLPDGLIPTATSDVTVSLWVKSDSPARNGAAIGFGTAPVNNLPANYWLMNPTAPNGSARSVVTDSVNATAPWTTEVQVAGPSTTARRGQWVHYVSVFTAGTLTAYVDGVKIGSVAKSRTFADYAAAGTLQGYLGRSGYAADAAFKGSLRELTIYDEALSDAQVGAVYADSDFLVEAARDRLDLGDTTAVTGDLTLPTTMTDGVSVAWATSDATVITATGEVTVAATERTATLTATLTRGSSSATKDFTITVAGRGDVIGSVEDLLVVPTVMASGDQLPTVDMEGVTTSWTTASAGLHITDGAVAATQRTSGQVRASVTASGTDPVVKTFDVTVLPAEKARFVLGYTRTPLDTATYGPNVAHSLHLALGADRTGVTALNENYGIGFAKAVPTATIELNEVRTLIDPFVFRFEDGTFGVVATRALSGGTPDSSAATSVLLLTSPDLRDFTDAGVVEVDPEGRGVRRPSVHWDSSAERYVVAWETSSGTALASTTTDLADPASYSAPRSGHVITSDQQATTTATGAVAGNTIVVDAATAEALRVRFGRIANTTVDVAPQTVEVGSEVDLSEVDAELAYDDGSTATRAIDWNASSLAAVDTDEPGEYTVTGTVRQTDYPFPFIGGRADPAIIRWQGKYLFIATTESGQSTLLVRSSDTLEGLRTTTDNTILGQGGQVAGPLWAPEFHIIDGHLFVYFASGVERRCWCNVQSHVMELVGADPTLAASWAVPEIVRQPDGTRLQLDPAHPGISLDMTYWEDERDGETVAYAAWSQRYVVNNVIGDAQLWIATVDPEDPAQLTSAPVMFASPDLGWDHNTAAVLEAPYVVERDGTVFLTYSGSGTDATYAVGLLTARSGADLTDPAVWTKTAYPLLKSDPATRQIGPGHSMFTTDRDGNLVLVYHARNNGGSRDTALRRVHWAADGFPILDMTADEEVAPVNRTVSTTVTVVDADDTTAPELEVVVEPTEPGASGWYTGPVRVRATATDDSGNATIQVRTGEGEWTAYDAPLAPAEGTTVLTFRASDEAGNVSEPLSRTIRRDATTPSATASTTPVRPDGSDGWFTTGDVRVVVTGADAGSGVARTEIRVGDGAWHTYTDPVAVPVGTTVVQYRVTDAAGLVSTVHSTTIRLDPAGPRLRLKKRAARERILVTAVARDDGSGIGAIRYRLDGGPWKAYRSAIRVTRPGRHTLAVRVTDRAGNVTTRRLRVRVAR